ncbi:hypothetical protein HPP92_021738 [Vanilla planifolia]|uniref:Uncharacterized protein n=1 Tax=Vanilla planifolia TaxID=51239 RepID=A0A835PU03_VANPL|nr:hypothetical protein HPP92_021738 [Vanilla planifolia]
MLERKRVRRSSSLTAVGDDLFSNLHVLPATHIFDSDALKLFSYLISTKSYLVTMLCTKPAPLMAQFSSQGPNTITPKIFKISSYVDALLLAFLQPDIITPEVNIIAAYMRATSPTGYEFDNLAYMEPFCNQIDNHDHYKFVGQHAITNQEQNSL